MVAIGSSCSFSWMKKNQKIMAVCKSYGFVSICGGAKPNSSLLRRDSPEASGLLLPPPISQNRDLQKAGQKRRFNQIQGNNKLWDRIRAGVSRERRKKIIVFSKSV
jgi:hypothetical protein